MTRQRSTHKRIRPPSFSVNYLMAGILGFLLYAVVFNQPHVVENQQPTKTVIVHRGGEPDTLILKNMLTVVRRLIVTSNTLHPKERQQLLEQLK